MSVVTALDTPNTIYLELLDYNIYRSGKDPPCAEIHFVATDGENFVHAPSMRSDDISTSLGDGEYPRDRIVLGLNSCMLFWLERQDLWKTCPSERNPQEMK